MNKKVLTDLGSALKIQLHESDSGGNLIARGEFGRADVPTQNRRAYPRSVWKKEIQRIQEAIRSGKVLGELDHPADGKTSLKRVSHIITGLEMTEEGIIVGEARILDNEFGRQLASILKAGGAVGVSSRGIGSTSMGEDGVEVVQDDYQYMTHDFVADPAVLTSYPKFTTEVRWIKPESVVSENKEKEMKDKQVEKSEPVATQVEAKTEKVAEEAVKLSEETAPAETVEAPKAPEAAAEVQVATEVKVEDKQPTAQTAAAEVVVEEFKKLLTPFVLPEDIQAKLTEKDAEIEALKKVVESKDSEIKKLGEDISKVGEVCNKLGVQLMYDRETAKLALEDKADVLFLIGEASKYSKTTDLEKALSEAKKTVSKKRVEEAKKKAELQKVEESYKAKISSLEESNKKLNKALEETVKLTKQLSIKAYVEERVKDMSNGSHIQKLCEGKTDQSEVDEIIKTQTIAPKLTEEYNGVRRRFNKLQGTKLVEEHMRDTGTEKRAAQSAVVEEGVEGEMQDLFPGQGLQQVKSLM